MSLGSWFDVSVSLETVHSLRVNGPFSILWSSYDVHPPVYYYILYFWSYLNPGVSEYFWAQELSVLFGLGFVFFTYLCLKKLFGTSGEKATVLLVLCTTYLHFFTEVRMYSILLFLSSVIFYCILNDLGKFSEGKTYLLFAGLCMFLLPMIQYYSGAVAVVFYLGFSFIWMKKRKAWDFNKWMALFICGMLGLAFAFFGFAIYQKARMAGGWFEPPTILDWPSAVFYAYFVTEGMPASIIYALVYFFLLGVIVFFFWKIFTLLSKGKDMGDGELAVVFMVLTSILPMVGILATSLFGEGFNRLYHHRFFIVITWMFAAATFVLFFRWIESKKKWVTNHLATGAVVLVLLVLAFFIWQYSIYAHHELENVMFHTPCTKEKIYIAHESPFSALPYQFWARQYGCNWWNFVSAMQTPKMLNGGGGDVMLPGTIFYNRTLPENMGNYYYIYAEGSVPIDGNRTILWRENGVELWYVIRQTHREGDKMIWWYDNESRYTRVKWN